MVDIPQARSAGSAFAIGNYGFVGFGTDGSTKYNDLWRYDPVANSWTQVASLPSSK